jgi:hypothetical protein
MYNRSEATCSNNTEASLLRHAVILRLYCDLTVTPFYISEDAYFECADASYDFDFPKDMFENQGRRFMCSTLATFPNGSSAEEVLTKPDVAIITDDYWLTNPNKMCYMDSGSHTLATSVPSPITSTVSFAPVLNAPISSLQNFSAAPFASSSSAIGPIFSTTDTQKMPTPLVIVGGVVGGFMLVVILSICAWKGKVAAFCHKPNTTNAQNEDARGVHDHALSATPDVPHILVSTGADAVIIANVRNQPRTVGHSTPVDAPDAASIVAPSPLPYVADYKDQCRTVVGQSKRPQNFAEDGPLQMLIPVAMATEIVAVSNEPPGRRMEEL